MNKFIDRYREMYLYLEKGRNCMSAYERKVLMRQFLRLEKLLVSRTLKRMLSGALVVDISQLPPRFQYILRIAFQRRMHIMTQMRKLEKRNIEVIQKAQLRTDFTKFVEMNKIENKTQLQEISLVAQHANTSHDNKHKMVLELKK